MMICDSNTINDFQFIRSNYEIADIRSVEYVGKYAFFQSSKLEQVYVSNRLHTLSDRAFGQCTSLNCIDLSHSNIQHIDNAVFHRCSSLKSMQLPYSLEYLGEEAFRDCYSLSTVSIDGKLTILNTSTFCRCFSLQSIDLRKSQIIHINMQVFESCINLKQILFSECLKSIGKYAFANCQNLVEIALPPSIEYIDIDAFTGCKSLETVRIGNNMFDKFSDSFQTCPIKNVISNA